MQLFSTIEQVATEALVKYGSGTKLDINSRCAKIFDIPVDVWEKLPSRMRAIAVMMIKNMTKDDKEVFVTSDDELRELALWISDSSTNIEIKNKFARKI